MQKAVVQFQCDTTRTGNDESDKKERRDEEEEDDDGDDDQSGKDLQYVSYKDEETDDGIAKVLRLNWKTKYACQDYVDGGSGGDPGASWGFFTWFILM
jgi:autophagy-related protein 27